VPNLPEYVVEMFSRLSLLARSFPRRYQPENCRTSLMTSWLM